MAGVAFITGKRYINGSEQDVFYIGSVQNDGYTYFNDNTFFRCSNDGSNLQLFYIAKQNWIRTSQITNINVLAFDVSGLIGTVGSIVGGSGAVAPNASVEEAVKWAINKATNNYITYSQTNRNLKNVNGLSYDCSSFLITAFYAAGFDISATYTGNMRAGFTAVGFEWIPGSYFAASQCQRGDILLNEALHTQMYIGNNQDVNCGSTPAGVQSHSPDNYGRGWDGILRYRG